jgi:hypothetical protein
MLGAAQEESADKDTVVAQSQGMNPLPLVLWSMLIARANRRRMAIFKPPTPPAVPSHPSDRACRTPQ